ncbi:MULTISPECIES: LysR family transcriptional regulator [Arthrobacter]|uniref:LysR family transcriptional regulator n=1 Tax=Arthrobacter terricola TaxID=2547396 RepID=A0A4R5K9M8_9MICC|nr:MULTISPECIES: LysR family transcriptional regulator [Arthrobacter]MBT8163133.1 LysR family transcriptional regulator [Arthrobacter sp. GN70]TDF91295.1 LysR family transcriptional regulator [Arthrobacter terricola]
MTLAQLEAFVAAATGQTFTAAAAELGMSQPAVSDLIRRLEGEFGAPLFNRSGRSLVLTAAGEELLPYAEQTVFSAKQGTEAVNALLSLGGGTATFGLLRNADFYIRQDLAKRFRQKHPQVRIRLVGQNSAETVSDVVAGHLEAGLVTLPVEEDHLDVLPLARDEVVYVSAVPERVQTPPDIVAMCNAPMILYDAHYAQTDPARIQLSARARLRGLTLNPGIEVEYLSAALSLAADGFGDTIACRAALESEVFPRGLHAVSLAEPMFDTLALIKRHGQLLSPATKEMARLAHSALIDHQASDHGTAELLGGAHDIEAFLG